MGQESYRWDQEAGSGFCEIRFTYGAGEPSSNTSNGEYDVIMELIAVP